MIFPAIRDTIVAVATGWQPAALAIVRLSGPEAFCLAAQLGAAPPPLRPAAGGRARRSSTRVRIAPSIEMPAGVLWFHAPHSFTGQDVVELHIPGCLPIVRELTAQLIRAGARRALPGEFTARAYLAGKFAAGQVEHIRSALHAADSAAQRNERRQADEAARAARMRVLDRLTDLLARIEAGIDFVEEEDIRFIAPAEVAHELDELCDALSRLGAATPGTTTRGLPHVALVGRSNAGKSTLFNALLGTERAIVSPVIGTTRDVLAAEIDIDGRRLAIQDCAGECDSANDLDIAARIATEQAAETADLVLWVHGADQDWTVEEIRAISKIEPSRRLLVLTKTDRAPAHAAEPPTETNAAYDVRVNARLGDGLDRLRSRIVQQLSTASPIAGTESPELVASAEALRRARSLVALDCVDLRHAELISAEIRTACDLLAEFDLPATPETILKKIFTEFCIGK